MPSTTTAEPCWVLTYTQSGMDYDAGDGIPHFATEHEAAERLAEMRQQWAEYDRFAGVPEAQRHEDLKPRRQDYVCVLGPDCVECGGSFEEWTDGWNHLDPSEVDQRMAENDWRKTAKGWLCGDHRGLDLAAVSASGEVPQ